MTYNTDDKCNANGKKTYQITVRVSDKTRQRIESFAAKQGIDVAKYVRNAIEIQLMIDEEFPEVSSQMERMENTEPANSKDVADSNSKFEKELNDFKEQITKMLDDFESKYCQSSK